MGSFQHQFRDRKKICGPNGDDPNQDLAKWFPKLSQFESFRGIVWFLGGSCFDEKFPRVLDKKQQWCFFLNQGLEQTSKSSYGVRFAHSWNVHWSYDPESYVFRFQWCKNTSRIRGWRQVESPNPIANGQKNLQIFSSNLRSFSPLHKENHPMIPSFHTLPRTITVQSQSTPFYSHLPLNQLIVGINETTKTHPHHIRIANLSTSESINFKGISPPVLLASLHLTPLLPSDFPPIEPPPLLVHLKIRCWPLAERTAGFQGCFWEVQSTEMLGSYALWTKGKLQKYIYILFSLLGEVHQFDPWGDSNLSQKNNRSNKMKWYRW